MRKYTKITVVIMLVLIIVLINAITENEALLQFVSFVGGGCIGMVIINTEEKDNETNI